ncbi:hypothetical protein THERMOT_1078 [Bathymodiolus thermophilus thioautotrophic gill symbiont]|uniref:Uncharacterized protein n=1 Tax=Bathymodiolus thermophilus thioautotrophic gill symbiont TaxID=2360 RepID=A0A8H9CG04_9GAMM|nr:hypothetical protein THERMOS_355 [Bathymodiolus thermophilus thioautotrophic gill symbiont]CAB5499596.1 hypothetical protein THERMOT_1078 [Bathymodiolus thermophilus thioautotrophic gill symbiont]
MNFNDSVYAFNGIKLFWGCARTKLIKFKGMNKNVFKYSPL